MLYLPPPIYYTLYSLNVLILGIFFGFTYFRFYNYLLVVKTKPPLNVRIFWIFLIIQTLLNLIGAVVSFSSKEFLLLTFEFFYYISLDSYHVIYSLILANTLLLVARVLRKIKHINSTNRDTGLYIYYFMIIPGLGTLFKNVLLIIIQNGQIGHTRSLMTTTAYVSIVCSIFNFLYSTMITIGLIFCFTKLAHKIAENELTKNKYKSDIEQWKTFTELVVIFQIFHTFYAVLLVVDFFMQWNYLVDYSTAENNGKIPVDRIDLVENVMKYTTSIIILVFSPIMNSKTYKKTTS
eukprot:GAHX01000956.1.p1 GENE.GAHX01000956.1~~GAHX01000956.1.p1  ORF type:complete len:293 (+),score=22.70 GAHX01000956.1:80-958(+)